MEQLVPDHPTGREAQQPKQPPGQAPAAEIVVAEGDVQVIHALGGVAQPTDGASVLVLVGAGKQAATLDRYRAIAAGMVVSDAFCILIALLLSYFLRFHRTPLPLEYALAAVLAPAAWVATFHAFGLYSPHRVSPPEEFRSIIAASSMGVVLLTVGFFWTHADFSRAWVGLTWVLALSAELMTRRFWRWYQGRLRADGRLSFRTLIVGTNAEARRLADALRTHGSGYTPLGFVGETGSSVSPDSVHVIGPIDQLERVIREQGAECVFVASTAVEPEDVFRMSQLARRVGVEVRLSTNTPLIVTSRLSVQQVASTMTLALRAVRLTRTQALMKRSFDLAIASVAVLVTIPLWGLIALTIRLTSPGPVLFRQPRVTRGGRVFTMYKFRTMLRGGDGVIDQQGMDPTQPFFKIPDDPRLTGVGRVLRRTSLDELPQLFNVLKGDMSLVGPRPLPAEQVAANLELLEPRHEVPAGVTGWWQIHGRKDLTLEEALRHDFFYIENWSLTLDLYILSKTLGAVIAGKGAI
jgi:exopolysaccharide biosynthesis polyprenyl glycosylphosphotransferase